MYVLVAMAFNIFLPSEFSCHWTWFRSTLTQPQLAQLFHLVTRFCLGHLDKRFKKASLQRFPLYAEVSHIQVVGLSVTDNLARLANLDEGTLFTTNPNTTQELVTFLTTQLPGLTFGTMNTTIVEQLLNYYPTDPGAGSPYNTGNNTFGKATQYKRAASVIGDLIFEVIRVLRIHCFIIQVELICFCIGFTKGFPASGNKTGCSILVCAHLFTLGTLT
jgi:hypothetical protein